MLNKSDAKILDERLSPHFGPPVKGGFSSFGRLQDQGDVDVMWKRCLRTS
jgi:hypothetical protein